MSIIMSNISVNQFLVIHIDKPCNIARQYVEALLRGSVGPKYINRYFNLELESGVLNTFISVLQTFDMLRTLFVTEYKYNINNREIRPDAIIITFDLLHSNNFLMLHGSKGTNKLLRGIAIVECKSIRYFMKPDNISIRRDRIREAIRQLSNYISSTNCFVPVYLLMGVPYKNLDNIVIKICNSILKGVLEQISSQESECKDININCIVLLSEKKYICDSRYLEISVYGLYGNKTTSLRSISSCNSCAVTNIREIIKQMRKKLSIKYNNINFPQQIARITISENPHISLLTRSGKSGRIVTEIAIAVKPRKYQ